MPVLALSVNNVWIRKGGSSWVSLSWREVGTFIIGKPTIKLQVCQTALTSLKSTKQTENNKVQHHVDMFLSIGIILILNCLKNPKLNIASFRKAVKVCYRHSHVTTQSTTQTEDFFLINLIYSQHKQHQTFYLYW